MPTLLIHRARCIATQDDANTELKDASILVRDGRIERLLTADEHIDMNTVDEVIDARHHVVIPGMVNTHHHMVQCLTRAIPQVQNAELFSWLRGLYPIWSGLTPEMVLVSNQIAMAELLLSGCTTSSDHLYIYPNGIRLEDSIEAAHTIGMRFTATRGAMSVGQSKGGLPPDHVVEDEAFILKESQRLIETWHDASFGAMTHVAVAPCSPFSVSQDLMRESAKLARSYGVRMHNEGVRVVSIPKTMDNDVFGTDYCIGFSTAITRSVDAINALRTTAGSHERIAVIELFGRRSGETALLAGFLAQVDRTVIAEVPADPDALIPLLVEDRLSRPDRYAMCVISEGATLVGDDAGEGERRLSATQRSEQAVSRRLALMIEKRAKQGTIVQQLAYLMRSGDPDALDRMVGFAFGGLAVRKIAAGETGRMLALRDGNYTSVPIDSLLGGTKSVDVAMLYDPARYRPRLTHVEGMPMFLY